MALLDGIEEVMEAAGLLSPPGETVVAAVSGGADSTALLALLHALAGTRPLRIHVAHLDHGLRGAESDEDAAYVLALGRRFNLPVTVEKADVAKIRAQRRLSWEAAAREARYDFLARVAVNIGSSAVLLGHTADDQVETVLMHLLRGTGIRGLRGMLPISRWRSRDGSLETPLVRPLLNARRHNTEAYCASLGLVPRQDSSNLDRRFTRNRVRYDLLPYLEQFSPSVREAVTRLARIVTEDVAYLDQQVREAWPLVVAQEPLGMRLDRRTFNGLHPSLQAHLLQRVYVDLVGEASDLNLVQVEGMRRLARQGAGRSLSLGHGIRFFTTYRDLFMAGAPPASPWSPVEERPLLIPSETLAQGWRIAVRCLAGTSFPRDIVHDDPFRAYLNLDAVGTGLTLRARLPGDRFRPQGMDGTKKIKEFMIDARIPSAWRDTVPLVVGKEGVAWVVGWRIAQWARVTAETREVVEVTFSRES
jgi:tRNA(Ile)-lysidine synthase